MQRWRKTQLFFFSSASAAVEVEVLHSRGNFLSAQVKTNKVVLEQWHKGRVFIRGACT